MCLSVNSSSSSSSCPPPFPPSIPPSLDSCPSSWLKAALSDPSLSDAASFLLQTIERRKRLSLLESEATTIAITATTTTTATATTTTNTTNTTNTTTAAVTPTRATHFHEKTTERTWEGQEGRHRSNASLVVVDNDDDDDEQVESDDETEASGEQELQSAYHAVAAIDYAPMTGMGKKRKKEGRNDSGENGVYESDGKGNGEGQNSKRRKNIVTIHSIPPSPQSKTIPTDESLQSYLTSLLTSHGYTIRTRSSRELEYMSPPTPLQRASYGTAVLDAVRRSDDKAFASLLHGRSPGGRVILSPNPRGPFGEDVMHISCRRGLGRLVKIQLDAGATVRVADSLGRTPLHHACWSGHVLESSFRIVKMLLDEEPGLLFVSDEAGRFPLDFVWASPSSSLSPPSSSFNGGIESTPSCRASMMESWRAFLAVVADTYWPPSPTSSSSCLFSFPLEQQSTVPRAHDEIGNGTNITSKKMIICATSASASRPASRDPDGALLSPKIAAEVSSGRMNPTSFRRAPRRNAVCVAKAVNNLPLTKSTRRIECGN